MCSLGWGEPSHTKKSLNVATGLLWAHCSTVGSAINRWLGASFFCSWDFEDQRNLCSILSTLAVQLARKYPWFWLSFIWLVQSDPEIIHKFLYNQMKNLIVQPHWTGSSYQQYMAVLQTQLFRAQVLSMQTRWLAKQRTGEPALWMCSRTVHPCSHHPCSHHFQVHWQEEQQFQEAAGLPPMVTGE